MTQNQVVIEQQTENPDFVHAQAVTIRLMEKLAEVRSKQKTIREMIDEYLDGNDEFRQLDKAYEEAKTIRNQLRSRLMVEGRGRDLNLQDKEVKSEIQDIKQGIGNYMTALYRMGVSEIDVNGQPMELILKPSITNKQLSLF